MLTTLEVFPLLLNIVVHLQLRIAFGIAVAVFDIGRNKIGENQCIDTFALIRRLDGHKEQIDQFVHAAYGIQQKTTAERQETPADFRKRPRELRHGNAYGNKFAGGIYHKTHILQTKDAEILLYVMVDLTGCKARETV